MKAARLLDISVIALTAEKLFQHAVLAVLFAIAPWTTVTPDIGQTFDIPDIVMAALNLVYLALMALGLGARWQGKRWGTWLILVMALADIVLEFVFHHLFFITVSVIVSALLSLATIAELAIRQKRI